MPQEYIEIRGARENNLKNVSLRIPKHKITIENLSMSIVVDQKRMGGCCISRARHTMQNIWKIGLGGKKHQ
jgi:hypothetical protein